MRRRMVWVLLRWLDMLLEVDRDRPVIVVLEGDGVVVLQESGCAKEVRRFGVDKNK